MKMGTRPVATLKKRLVHQTPRLVMCFLFAVACAFLLQLVNAPAWAQAGAVTYQGFPIEPTDGLYMVKTDVKVRSEPNTRSKRLGVLEEGEKIRVFGKAEGSWVAAEQDGKKLGFVYEPALHRLFEGALGEDISGEVTLADDRTCDYIIRYTGTSPVDGEFFETSDYEVGWQCAHGETVLEFESFLYVSEALVKGGAKNLYEVTMDVWEIQQGYEQVFSTTTKYDPDAGTVTYHSLSIDKYEALTKPEPRNVDGVPEMLAASVEMIVQSWNDQAWATLENLDSQAEPPAEEAPISPEQEPAG